MPFIVIEGADGAGTTTHAEILTLRLQAAGHNVIYTCEPTSKDVGQIIRGELKTALGKPDWRYLALLFAADRVKHSKQIDAWLKDEDTYVISDRFYYSTLVYQGIAAYSTRPDAYVLGRDSVYGWLLELNKFARTPDLTFVLDVEPAEAQRRRVGRSADAFERDDFFQVQVCELYKKLEDVFTYAKSDRFECIRHIDAMRDKPEVSDDIYRWVQRLCPVELDQDGSEEVAPAT